MSEAPLISRALRLVSLGLIISTVALVATAGYSGLQEYKALTGSFSSQQQQSGLGNNSTLTSSNSSSSLFSFNGTNLILSGLNIPNNMSFPLSVQLGGSVGLAGTTIGSFTTQMENIPPGQSQAINLNIALDYQKVLSNQSALDSLLFNSTLFTFTTRISANIVPLIGLNLTSSQNSTMPPVLGNFSMSAGNPSCTLQGCTLPIEISWINNTPISFNNGSVTIMVTSLPNGGNPSSIQPISFPLNLALGSNNENESLFFPANTPLGNQQNLAGTIGLSITFAVFGASATIPESVTIP